MNTSHSTETCLLKISNDALLAFDFGISGFSLSCVTSYLSNRSSAVSINNSSSSPLSVPFGVFQRSVLGPLFFILYTSHLPCLMGSFSFQSQLLADDTYIFSSFPLSSLSSTLDRLTLSLFYSFME